MNCLPGLISLAGLKPNRQIADAAKVKRRLLAKRWVEQTEGGHGSKYPMPRIKAEQYCSLGTLPHNDFQPNYLGHYRDTTLD